jgi:CRISPR-associated endoribonuclease Cas6
MRRFELEFTTPTAFAQQRLYLPFPLPALMFRSWLERWNHFAPVYLGRDELIGYLSDYVMVQRHQIKTRSLQLQHGYVNGFVGDVRLQVLKGTDPLLANVASLLVHYGQFAGTGVKTRLGMGQMSLKFG